MVHSSSDTATPPQKGDDCIAWEGLLARALNSRQQPVEVMECQDIEGHRSDKRPTWGRGLEFLMSCLSLSVGLGNIWRFPYACHQNGGAIFVIPYLIILFFIGKPFYFLEMILGQFTSKGSMRAIEVIPLMKGIGWGQQIASATITTYYTAIVGLCLSYLVSSFTWDALPWAECRNSSQSCYPAENLYKYSAVDNKTSSAALYFSVETLHMKSDISDGVGSLVPKLAVCLLVSWVCVYVSIMRGIKTSGKLAYFFAITPYIILIALLSFACTLEGALDGILYFINPGKALEKLWDAKVWYHACTQCFFSLTIGMGCIIMFSSYNKFDHNIYRDATIVSVMDTLTSMLGGLTIYAILGNLSANSGKAVKDVVRDSFGLAFITYPEAIAKIKTAMSNAWLLPQILSITFFAMLFVLGVGSTVGLMNNISTNLKDYFPNVKYWLFAGICSAAGCSIGLLYVTEGGINVLGLVDHFGGEFLIFTLATFELIAVVWIYGLQNICWDVEFMLKRKLSVYWRVCWGVAMPCFMLLISCFFVTKMENPMYDNNTKTYPMLALVGGWALFAIGCLQVPLCTAYLYLIRSNSEKTSFWRYLITPNAKWGPKSYVMRTSWQQFKSDKRQMQQLIIATEGHSWMTQKWWELMGRY